LELSAGLRSRSDARVFISLESSSPAAKAPPRFMESLSEGERRAVALESTSLRIRRGELVFRQGTNHDGIYIICAGRIRTFFVAPSGREITLALWTPHHFVGGPEVFGRGTHQWSGIAMTDSEVLHLGADRLRRMARELPGFAIALIEGLVYKGHCFSSLVQMLGTQSASARLAHVLLGLSELHGRPVHAADCAEEVLITQPFTHDQLASMIGVTRQWVSTMLGKWRSEGILRMEGRRVVVIDRAKLAAHCSD
jgi:CRP/FNR family transcriptional regulator, cyclic AMP receptor protein